MPAWTYPEFAGWSTRLPVMIQIHWTDKKSSTHSYHNVSQKEDKTWVDTKFNGLLSPHCLILWVLSSHLLLIFFFSLTVEDSPKHSDDKVIFYFYLTWSSHTHTMKKYCRWRYHWSILMRCPCWQVIYSKKKRKSDKDDKCHQKYLFF